MRIALSKASGFSKLLARLTNRRMLIVATLGGVSMLDCLLYSLSWVAAASQKAMPPMPVNVMTRTGAALGRLSFSQGGMYRFMSICLRLG